MSRLDDWMIKTRTDHIYYISIYPDKLKKLIDFEESLS